MARLQRLFSLGAKESALLAEAWITLAWIDVIIRVVPYKRWPKWFHPTPHFETNRPTQTSSMPRCIRLIQITEMAARNHLWPMNCLRRCLSQQRMLSRRSIGSQLHIGVKKTENRLEAHAWLSLNGYILNDTPDVTERYSELEAGSFDSNILNLKT